MEDRSRRQLGSRAKEIIYNVSERFLKTEGPSSFIQATADATGVSSSTVNRIRREQQETGQLLSPQRQPKRGPYKPVDDFDKAVIRSKITECYTTRKQLPTLHMLHTILVQDIGFAGSVSTLRKLIRDMGYRWKKTRDNRKVLTENQNIVDKRITFYRLKQNFEDRGLQFVYIDETWIDTAYTVKKCWQGPETPGVISPCNRGQRVIVVHAGTRDGFVPGACLVYKAKSKTGDYHSEMDGAKFTRWLEERVLQTLDQPSVIVMDNASYHSMRADKCPTSNSRKADIQEWLRKEGINFQDTMLRPQLLQLVKMNKKTPEYTVDNLIRYYGHEVLRLPPYHPDFNPIEMIWSQLKSSVRSRNVTFKYDDVLRITEEVICEIGTDRWRSVCRHVDTHIDKCKASDNFMDEHIDSFLIDLRDDTESEDSD